MNSYKLARSDCKFGIKHANISNNTKNRYRTIAFVNMALFDRLPKLDLQYTLLLMAYIFPYYF